MWCIMSSPLLIGCNMANIKEQTLSLLKNRELIALNQDPLGLQAYVVQHHGDTYILAKDILSLHGKTRAVAFYNPSDREVEMYLSFSEVDLGGQVTVRDLFEHKEIGTMEKGMSVYVPPHATRIYKLEAETRLDRYIYEAETAFMQDYQEIYNNQSAGTAIYEKTSSASGGVFAGWLGGRRSNSLEWKDVHIAEAGDYTIHFAAASKESRSFNVVLNGEELRRIVVQTTDWGVFKEYDITVPMNASSNAILLYNENGWMPNIDYMSIEKSGENTILNRRLEETIGQLEMVSHNSLLTNKLRQNAEQLIKKATAGDLLNSQIKTLLKDSKNLLNTINQLIPTCIEYHYWKNYSDKNIEASQESTPLNTLKTKVERCETSFSIATTQNQISTAIKSLKTALTTYFHEESAMPKEGKQFDMTILISNYDFSSEDGWKGEPTYRSGCGEEFNKTFDLHQILTNMKPGIYTIKCNALYRTKNNDAGAAYKAGTENIQAYLYANEKKVKIKSLYSETWPNASLFSSSDNLNGYPHSMHAANIRFAEGCYQNKLQYSHTERGTLQFGLKCNNYINDNWCCFDNFELHYQATKDYYDGITSVQHSEQTAQNDTYDLSGRKYTDDKNNTKEIVIKNGIKILR